MLIFWVIVYIFELLTYSAGLWRLRHTLIIPLLILVVVSSSWLLFDLVPLLVPFVAFLTLFRVFNLARIVKGRMHPYYLRRVCQRTSQFIFGYHLVVAWLFLLANRLTMNSLVDVLSVLQLLITLSLLTITLKNVGRLKFRLKSKNAAISDLPTVSVAIPARNETAELEACLKTVLASDYPKLEIIVLDDCSQDQTAEIIKKFAHDGVRFVQGDEPKERWLAKNQAYQKLYSESTGDFVLFLGVDVRIGPQAISNLIKLAQVRKKKMISVLPQRRNGTALTALVQPMRYWWELALPRRAFERPPVLSSCWLIKRSSLMDMGGFSGLSHSVLPEGYLARGLIKTDGYSFIRSSSELEVLTQKSFAEQRATEIRTLYPKIRRRPENALALTVFNIFFLLGPFWFFIVGVIAKNKSTVQITAMSVLLLILTHLIIMRVSDQDNMLFGLFNYPLAVIIETTLGYVSMIQYEFFTVEWKERNICIPVMHVVPRLPDTSPES